MSNQNFSIKVDVIIPNFNKGIYLKEAINSVIQQTYKNWNLFIVDDNSKDSSKKILKNYSKNKKINIFYLKKNKGPGYCRNFAISKSKSKLIAFLDSDDFWTKDKLKSQIIYMKKNKLSFTYTDYISFYQNGTIKKIIGKTNVSKNFNFSSFIKNTSINTSTMIVYRELIKSIKFKNLKKLEDYIFKCEIFKKNNKMYAVKFNKPTAYYRLIKNARSTNKLKNIYYLWKYNKVYNKLNIFQNLISISMISINSFKKYGFKMGV
jgi:teichuronic acid biosynthesis glycosyltransferase TuaG